MSNKKKLNNQTIYQVFVRQFSDSHDFNGVTAQLDRIKALGADILYLMPFYPIGEKGRKGSVGSPYSISDYRAIDPANGTLEDFTRLLSEAHARGLKVIIDMVLNHTSRDSVLLQRHPEWFWKDADGNVGNRVGDWSDVCDLDYSDKGLVEEITDILCYWVKLGVDGYRMDVCSLVSERLWKFAVPRLRRLNGNLFMLGESVDLGFIRYLRSLGYEVMSDGECYKYFDALYCYDIGRAQGSFIERKGGTLARWIEEILGQEGRYPADYVKARYLDNHDRKRVAEFWQGDSLKTLWALNFYLKGVAFVYAGDETSAERQPSLFENDAVQWAFDTSKDISPLISRLASIKKRPIYREGAFDAVMQGDDAVVCSYSWNNRKSVGIFVLGEPRSVEVPLPDGRYVNKIDGKTVYVRNGSVFAGTLPVILEK